MCTLDAFSVFRAETCPGMSAGVKIDHIAQVVRAPAPARVELLAVATGSR
jgi:hypothetical protein